MRKRRRSSAKQRTGAVLVEMALVLPVFFLLVFTCFEFTRLNMIRNLTQDAAYFASRHCMVPGATAKEAETEARRILSALGAQGVSVSINDGKGLDENSSSVTVKITVPIGQNAFFASQFTGKMNMVAESTMRTERYDGFYDPNR